MCSERTPTGMLPPCRVCGLKASGLHYGVNTCEACKAFFRRSAINGHLFECANEDSCKLDGKNRSSCACCRFQKCLSLGMGKDAIKTGRYSHLLRACNVREIKNKDISKEICNKNKDDPTNIEPIMINNSCSSTAGDRRPTSDSGCNNSDILSDDTVGLEDGFSVDEFLSKFNCTKKGRVNGENEVCENILGNDFYKISIDSNKKIYDISKVEIYDGIIEKLCDAHKKLEADYMTANETLEEKESECLEMVKLREQIFGPLRPVSVEEYIKFYAETGIDIDGRRELMEASILPLMEYIGRQSIFFAKSIPLFTDLPLSDQIALIKGSRLDFFLLGRHRWFNPKEKLFTFKDGRVVHVSDIFKLVDRDVAEYGFILQQRMRDLNLREEETAVLCSLSVMCPDYSILQNRQLVEESQELLVECLCYIFDKNYSEYNLRFARVINCLLQMRTLREDNEVYELQLSSSWFGILNFPPLVTELCRICTSP